MIGSCVSRLVPLFFMISLFFWLQVFNVQQAGYRAAIVHNVGSDDLIPMRGDGRRSNLSFNYLVYYSIFINFFMYLFILFAYSIPIYVKALFHLFSTLAVAM